jgi:hypothetical protein
MNDVIRFAKKHLLTLIGTGVGLLGGFLYWNFVGCTSGGCPITGNPVISSLWGGMIGGLFFNMFEKKSK